MDARPPRLAVLVDAENAQLANLPLIMTEIAKLGVASVKRAYGDFAGSHLSKWRESLVEHSIQPVQQFSVTSGKNASDIALVIDAMDLLHSGRFDGFCIVSSDSDFTRLASRLREEGVVVYGVGEKKTPRTLIAACDKFILTENLSKKEPAKTKSEAAKQPSPLSREIVETLRDAIESAADDTGWSELGQVGYILISRMPEFDSRTYGHRNLSSLLGASEAFTVRRDDTKSGGAIRVKPA